MGNKIALVLIGYVACISITYYLVMYGPDRSLSVKIAEQDKEIAELKLHISELSFCVMQLQGDVKKKESTSNVILSSNPYRHEFPR